MRVSGNNFSFLVWKAFVWYESRSLDSRTNQFIMDCRATNYETISATDMPNLPTGPTEKWSENQSVTQTDDLVITAETVI